MTETLSKKDYYDAVNNKLNIDEVIMVKLFETDDNDFIPKRSNDLDAGFDCRARLKEDLVIQPMERAKVPLGFGLNVPADHVGDLRPRSGLMDRKGIVCGYGTVDAGYTNEVSATIFNFGSEPFIVEPKMRIAQLVLMPLAKSRWAQNESRLTMEVVPDLVSGERGLGGHGSTGLA